MKNPGGSGGKGHTSKHAGTHKHHAHGAKHHPKHQPAHHHAAHHQHNVHTKAKHPHHGRGLAIGDWLPVCSLEAVAMSLRLAGQPVADDEVAWLWELCGSRELSIPEALEVAARFGLAGFRPVHSIAHPGSSVSDLPQLRQREDDSSRARSPVIVFGDADLDRAGTEWDDGQPVTQDVLNLVLNDGVAHALILGVDRPGPHAVLATPGGWWSWGQLWTPWTRAVSEAWVVSWT